MLKAIIVYKGIRVYFRKITYKNVPDSLGRTCPLCNNKITEGNGIYLITNNYRLFPNLYTHETCATLEKECVEKLVKLYEEFKMIKEKYKTWLEEPCMV